ncbi:MAG: hypothetical protein A2X64_01820 [Ignavibacteria bacterium GWF2_33_9]|nr:MAG: hypothetical protein A2X64_01820 [Ignavibacteria bacterium GWF2_33_9]
MAKSKIVDAKKIVAKQDIKQVKKTTKDNKLSDVKIAAAKKTTTSKAAKTTAAPVKTVAKAVPAKKSAPVKTVAKAVPAKKSAPVKTVAKAAPTKKSAPVKTLDKAAPAKKSAPVKTVAKTAPAKKSAPVKTAAKKVEATVNKKEAKEIKKAIKKAPSKSKLVNPNIEKAKIAVLKPIVNKTADQMEQDLIKSHAVESDFAEAEKTNKTQKPKVAVEVKEEQPTKAPAKAKKPNYDNTIIIDGAECPRYSDEDLAIFEEIILDAKKLALEDLRMLKERLEDLNSYDLAEESMIYSMHMGEQGSEPMEKEKTYAQIQRSSEYLKKLEDALSRIKNKTYGICRVCKILIAKERLFAVPITTLSASWKIHQHCPDDGFDKIEAI